MVRQGVETLDQADSIQLSYVRCRVWWSGRYRYAHHLPGSAGPFEAWLDGTWQPVKPYTARETLEFPAPYGKASVYWYGHAPRR